MTTVWPALCPALIADDDVVLFGQQVDDLTFGLITPLQSDNTRGRHSPILWRRKVPV